MDLPKPAPEPIGGKMEWLLATRERLRSLSPARTIRLVSGITPEIFLNEHYAANWPVVLADEMTGWPALERWTPDYLKRAVGDAPIEVQAGRTADADFERRMAAHESQFPFDAFIDRIVTGSPKAEDGGNDIYMTAYNAGKNRAALTPLDQDLGHIDTLLDPAIDGGRGMMWIGPEGTFTPLHHDLTNNLLLQIRGRKQIFLIAPGETPRLYNDHHVYSHVRDISAPDLLETYPALDGVRVHSLVLEPGHALFLPVGWWHQVRSLDFSISITHTNFRWPNDFWTGHPT